MRAMLSDLDGRYLSFGSKLARAAAAEREAERILAETEPTADEWGATTGLLLSVARSAEETVFGWCPEWISDVPDALAEALEAFVAS